ncbi:MAG: SUMF1/EgtB/PvdO family nonheme iron enzyme [Planctomycetes bacterium]|nr:SUMF1/EgtB/PvdO family nonheme iron enzyme [Planctomycetota bacterium]
MARCPSCGFENPDGLRFCGDCGARMAPVAPPEGGQQTLSGERTQAPVREESAGSGVTASGAARFHIHRKLGEGGMGAVFLAEDRSFSPPRRVAMKRLLETDAANRAAVARFLQEASAIAQLLHPNIITVFERGEDGQGQYIVMEYVEGKPLDDLIREKGTLSLEETIRIARGIGAGLSCAHRRRIIHRDIKPGNILIARDGTPKIADFGLARHGHGSELSVSGVAMGTMDYAAPEQRRDAKDVDHRADIFSLGATIYEMLTGSAPRQIRPERLPAAVRGCVLTCLEERPEDRYFSVDELLGDLGRIGGGRAPNVAARIEVLEPREGVCPRCGFANKKEARFCEECGAAFFEMCPGCSGEIRAGTKHCPRCGVNIQKAREEAAEPEPPQDEARETAIDLGGGVILPLSRIPAGEFEMGSPDDEGGRCLDEGPVHTVRIERPLWLGKFEVTQAQWGRLMGENPSHFKGPENPVERVSWYDGQAFLKKLNAIVEGGGFRLPTEAEWEHACRAGSATRFFFGDDPGYKELRDYAWFDGNAGGKTRPVGNRKANPWGLFDMYGNVWEWCQSLYKEYPYDPEGGTEDPAPKDRRVLRGGSWYDDGRICRSAYRGRLGPGERFNYIGLRVARTVT